jgi:hypothetical protein
VDEPTVTDVVSPEAQRPESSLMDSLRVKRQEVADTRTVDIPIAGFEEYGLTLQHRYMDVDETRDLGRKIAKEFKGNREDMNLMLVYDQVINSVVKILIRDPGNKKLVQLYEADGNTPVTRVDQLAEYLGWHPDHPENATARAALLFVFGDNEYAIGMHGIKLSRWMGNTAIDIDQEFLGE